MFFCFFISQYHFELHIYPLQQVSISLFIKHCLSKIGHQKLSLLPKIFIHLSTSSITPSPSVSI